MVSQAKRVKDKYGVANVYLATDSYRVVAQTKLEKYKEFNFFYQVV